MPENFNKWASLNQDRIARAEQRGTLPYFVRDNRERVKQAMGKEKVAIAKTTESIKPTFNARVSRSKSTDFQDDYAEVRDLIEQYKNISPKFINNPLSGKMSVDLTGGVVTGAMKELKYKEAPCKVIPQEATTEQLKAYTLKDNSGYGEWDFDLLNNEWDLSMLEDCAIDLPDIVLFREKSDDNDAEDDFDLDIDLGEIEDAEEDEKRSIIELMVSDRVYPTNNPFDIPVLRKDAQPINGLELPFEVWGADSRLRKDIKTYCFYVEDYRFEAIWKDPTVVVKSGVNAIVEPNLSLYDTTPIAYGLQQIYKKRWIARYFQECGILVYADLNVSQKFYEYNRLGILDGYNAFAIRGYNDRIEYLEREIDIAKQISGMDCPNMIVYGWGKD